VRTDFSDDKAWVEFRTLLAESEREIIADSSDREPNEHGDQGEEPSDESSSDDGASTTGSASAVNPPLTFFSIISPDSESDRMLLINSPNIAILRLVAEADIRPAPPVPQGSKRVKPGHRLIDLDGFQEIYRGRLLWIYDANSNRDGAVRMVNLEGDVYGTATCVLLLRCCWRKLLIADLTVLGLIVGVFVRHTLQRCK
jgi:hypothetical protein